MAQPTYTLEELSRKVDAISEFLNEKTDRNLLNLNTVGQAIIDGKVEVEALLAQNGYAKFTWKEDNKVASLIIQWGLAKTVGTPSVTGMIDITLPTSYTTSSYNVQLTLLIDSTDPVDNSVFVANYLAHNTPTSFRVINFLDKYYLTICY